MKVKYINENYFKNIEDIRADVQKDDALSKEERVNNVRTNARKYIQDLASERFDYEFKELVVGRANSIFVKSLEDNKITLKEIKYFFNGDIINAEFHIGIGHNGRYFGGNASNCKLTICYPENVTEIENSLKEEYGYKSKVFFVFEEDGNDAIPFFNIDTKLTYDNASQEHKIILDTTDCTDLTEFCYFLNSCKGIDFSEFTLVIKNLDNGTELTSTASKVELNNKFQKVVLNNFYPNEVDLTPILSNEILTEKHAAQLGYRGRWEDTRKFFGDKLTGILYIAPTFRREDANIEYFLDLIENFKQFAERMNSYKNLYVVCIIPSYIDYEYGSSGNSDLLSKLSRYLDNNYKLANNCGYELEDPGNIILSFQTGNSATNKLGVFPYLDYGEMGLLGGFARRMK